MNERPTLLGVTGTDEYECLRYDSVFLVFTNLHVLIETT